MRPDDDPCALARRVELALLESADVLRELERQRARRAEAAARAYGQPDNSPGRSAKPRGRADREA